MLDFRSSREESWQMELERLLAVLSVRASGAEAVAGDRTVGTISRRVVPLPATHTSGW